MYRVIVIDDETYVRRGIIEETDWQSLDCEVVGEAENGEQGLLLSRTLSPELLICDIRMPRLSGLELLQALRDEGNDVSVIFLTAYGEFSYAQNALRLEAADYLLKPFEDGELEAAVKKALEKREALRARSEAGKIRAGGEGGRSDKEREDGDGEDGRRTGDVRIGDAQTGNRLLPKISGKSRYVTAAADYIAAHYAEPELSVAAIAAKLAVSEGHLSHLFKKETEYTVAAYITRVRMRAAMELLSDCRSRVYETAEKVGYRDLAHFSNTFKKIVGMTPSEYQNR